MSSSGSLLIDRFESNAIEPEEFHHNEHLEVGYHMLLRYSFLETLERYTSIIRGLAERAGHPDKFNLTITVAFLSLIAERMAKAEYSDYSHFIEDSPDLSSVEMLKREYSPERIESSLARRVFLLPDKGRRRVTRAQKRGV